MGLIAALAAAAAAATWSVRLFYGWSLNVANNPFPEFAVFLLLFALLGAWLISRFIGLTLFPVTLASVGAGLIVWPGWGPATGVLIDCYFNAQCAIDGPRLAQAVRQLFAWEPLPEGLVKPVIGLAIIAIAAVVDYRRTGIRLGALTVSARQDPDLTSTGDGAYRLSTYLTVTNRGNADVQITGADLPAAWLLCRRIKVWVWAGSSRTVVDAGSPATVRAGEAESIEVTVAYEPRQWIAPKGWAHGLGRLRLIRSSLRVQTSSRTVYSKSYRLI